MNPPGDNFRPPPRYDTESSQILPRQRNASPSSSISSLPFRRANTSISNLFASTSSLPGSGRSSGSSTPTVLAGSVFSPPNGAYSATIDTSSSHDSHSSPRNLILHSFIPHVGVIASPDVDELLQEKGFRGGFLELIRPFGERINGKITIRNSVGTSNTWDDFGVRFTGLKDGLGVPALSRTSVDSGSNGRLSGSTAVRMPAKVGGDVPAIEELVDRHLEWAELMNPSSLSDDSDDDGDLDLTVGNIVQKEKQSTDDQNDREPVPTVPRPPNTAPSPFYTLYMRRLLSALPMTPHETFSHPVACCIVISSRSPNPIGELKELYFGTNTGDDRLPQWISNDYLRYYVLIHDEDRDDIAKSTSLYEQMRRSFGLHCHLLRLRSSQCLPSDDDSVRLPTSEWLSAAEELAEIQNRESDYADETDPTPYIFDADITSIRTFLRDLVAQSIIPSMERSIAQWNDQVLARRKGLSGRLMSFGRKFAGFGSSSSNSRNSSSPVQSTSSNYDSLQGFYRPDAPEATMRRLADWSFMLRDFRLAHSTYDILRGDFENDKAWRHYAGANEMAAVSALLSTDQKVSSKFRTETLDRMLDAATHSYVHRCIAPFYALRTLALGMELLRLRGFGAVDDAARWGARILSDAISSQQPLVGEVGHALFTQRISQCYASRTGIGSMNWGTRRRKAGLWAVLASGAFLDMGRTTEAQKCLGEARRLYGVTSMDFPARDGSDDEDDQEPLKFKGMTEVLDQLKEGILAARLQARQNRHEVGTDAEKETNSATDDEIDEPLVEEVSESLDVRPHRRSIVNTNVGGTGLDPLGVMTEPLSPVKLRSENPLAELGDEGFS